MARRSPDEWSKRMVERKTLKKLQSMAGRDRRASEHATKRRASDEAEGALRSVLNVARRRERLKTAMPPCPACGERGQVQLTDWMAKPASWKCRTCKHAFRSEGL